MVIYITLYSIAILESIFFIPKNIQEIPRYLKFPFNLDACLFCIPFLASGKYFKDIANYTLNKLNGVKEFVLTFIACFIVVIFIFLDLKGVINFSLDIKYSQYNNFILCYFIPIIWGFILLVLSKYIRQSKSLTCIMGQIGNSSMYIMYIHLIIKSIFDNYNWKSILEYIVIVIIISILTKKTVVWCKLKIRNIHVKLCEIEKE